VLKQPTPRKGILAKWRRMGIVHGLSDSAELPALTATNRATKFDPWFHTLKKHTLDDTFPNSTPT
jgi:hypothetical protein